MIITNKYTTNFTQFHTNYHFKCYNKTSNITNLILINLNYYYNNNIQN